MRDFTVGSTYNGFLLTRREIIAEIDSTVFLFTHEKLGTPVMAIKNSDPNKTFCAAFQTLPDDSTGVAHILEHAVLMGSDKFPVKDVFGEIHKGGLMTFLNAMTGSDTTFYPFATRNLQEYFNIMDVYCDVVFNPLLLPTTLEQEGWHYHKEDPGQPLTFQGVVYNEMKGALSDPIRFLFHNTFLGLLPGSTYAHESGGDPANIPDLTYEQFVGFHRRFYHPSNATLFFYGDAELRDELTFVQDNFLCRYDGPAPKEQIEMGTLISQPVLVRDTYGVQQGSSLAGRTFLSVSSAVGTILDRQLNTAFQIIAQILYNSEASPLKKAVLEAGLCKDFGGLFLANSCYTTIMMTYLIGSEPDALERFREIYRTTLGAMAQEGLDHDLVLSELNKYEFSVREDMGKAQRGLDLITKALPALKHGSDPFDALRINDLFAEIRARALAGPYFEELIRSHLLDNPATVEIILEPDPAKTGAANKAERDRLDAHENSLAEEGKQLLIDRTLELLRLQNEPNDPATLELLPRLRSGDLSRTPAYHEAQADTVADTLILTSELQTNSIAYVDFGLDCSMLDVDLLPWLDIFATIVTEIGTATKDYMQMARELGTYTGGFNTSFNTYVQRENPAAGCRPLLWFNLKALDNYLERALGLVQDIFSSVSFADRKRIREIVLREYAWAEHSVQSEGYSLASSRVFAHLSPSGRYNEQVSGATSYLMLQELARDYATREDAFIESLDRLRSALFLRQGLLIGVTGSSENIRTVSDTVTAVRDCFADGPLVPVTPRFPSGPRSQGLCTSADVAFNVQGCNLFADPCLYNGHFEVLKTWISRDYLWNTVRQVGGAYGCFVQFNPITGNIGLVSYRDPHVRKTYQAYDGLGDHIAGLDLSPQVMEQLIIGTYGTLDPHQPAAAKGATARNDYLSGITVDYKQIRMAQVLDTSRDDLRGFAPYFEQLSRDSYRATIGSGEKIREAADMFDEIVDL